jgi:hypothetical protein
VGIAQKQMRLEDVNFVEELNQYQKSKKLLRYHQEEGRRRCQAARSDINTAVHHTLPYVCITIDIVVVVVSGGMTIGF